MDGQTRIDFGSGDAKAAEARQRVERQRASLATSAGWLLTIIEYFSAIAPAPDAPVAQRLRRAALTLAWTSPQQERLAEFAGRYAALDGEAEAALAGAAAGDALVPLAVQLERTAAEALAFLSLMQADAQNADSLSETSGPEENHPARVASRAEIGAAVRARLPAVGGEKIEAAGLELYRVRGFLDPEECAALIALIERDLIPSQVLGDDYAGTFRTSKSCNLPPTESAVDAFETRAADLLGINRRFGEHVQGQRYEVGQQFKPHFDFFHADSSYYDDVAKKGGQRTWTAMAFLNEPEAGGRTDFPTARASAAPEAGTLLVWNNMRPDGCSNDNALHHGTPVLAGRKYVLTKWFRERPWA